MQLFSRNKALAALSLGALAALGACGDDVTVPAPVNPPVAVTISPSNANVNVGSFVDLAVAITGGTTTPTLATCSTSNAAVATAAVQGGNACRVTGVSTGAVSITAATSAGQTAGASVTVNAPVPAISGIAISPAAQNLQVGGTFTITANPTTQAPGATIARNFVSSNSAVATVNATTGVVTAVAPGQTTITVTLTGTGTGLTAANVTGQVAVTVTALPPSVTAVTATPSSATLIVAGTQQITATGTYATGITGTITYGTSNPGVATVSGTGLITAVGPGQATITVTASSAGNASFAAASATQQIPVTVNAPAQVSIANITSGTTNNPVNINNVAGQIQVQLNLVTNNNNVSSVALYVCDANNNCTSGSPAAQQNFGTAGAADGQINLFINTADFTTDFATATAKYLNGQKNLIAVLNVANSNANSNLAILNFNNTDGYAAKHTAPSRSAVNTSSNTTFFGGPGTDGRGRMQIAAVFYTPNRSLTTATVGLTGVCGGTLTFGGSGNPAFPIDYTYGYALTGSTTNINCGSQSNPNANPDVTGRVVASIDNAQNAGPVADPTDAPDNIANFLTTTSSIPAVTAPAIIRVDYQAPSVSYALTAPTNGELGWVNAAYSFANGTMSDAGVGSKANSTITYGFAGCGVSAYTAFSTNTGADIAECSTDFTGGLISGSDTRGPYTARATGQDLLTNEGTATTDNFGVDKTAPAIRYDANSDSLVIYDGVVTALPAGGTAADSVWQVEALDDRAGFISGAVQHRLARANQLLNTGSCVVTAATTVGSAFVTSPTCTYQSVAFTGEVMGDGYRPVAPILFNGTLAAGQGYWTYRARATDRAGNVTERENRYILINTTAPVMTGMGIPSTVTASGTNTFTPNFTEVVESRLNSFRVVYGVGDTLSFPAVKTYDLWDDAIGANGNTTMGKPFTSGVTFYTNIQSTLANNAIAASVPALAADTASVRPDSAVAGVTNVGGLASSFFGVALLDANITSDATAWTRGTASKGSLVDSFFVAASAAAWNSPAGGVKARVFANTNIINSPFTRIDFYHKATPAVAWNYAGSVDATTTPAQSPVAGATVYIADNGTQRVWTYVLRSVANTNGSLTALVGGYTNPLGTIATGCWRAIATSGSNGRVLSSQAVDLAGGAACVAP